MSSIESFINKRKQRIQTQHISSVANPHAAFISPTDLTLVKPALLAANKPHTNETSYRNNITVPEEKKKTTDKLIRPRKNNKITKEKNQITNYFTPHHNAEDCAKNTLDDDEEKVVLCIARKTIPLLDAWNIISEEYKEEVEEPVFYTVRKTKPWTEIWESIVQELTEDNTTSENKRKNEKESLGIKKTKLLFNNPYIYSNASIRRKLSAEESQLYMTDIMLEYQ
ncbi:hypothetical protein BY458DRAFT_555643 [Sporodiniella umbellata]|nr:hypothetical protein BY458DRAFT_555643 [Sporodiniella umbellata]